MYDIINNENNAVLNAGQSVVISCSHNYFERPTYLDNLKSTIVTCINKTTLEINHELLNYTNDFSCNLRVIEEVLTSVTDCPSNYRGVDFGYYNPINDVSYVIGESCYNTEKKETVFAHVKLRNGTYDPNNVVLRREDGNYFMGAHPSYVHRILFLRTLQTNNINNRIKVLLGSSDVISIGHKRFINEKYLSSKQFSAISGLTWNDLLIIQNGKSYNNLDILQRDVKELGLFDLDLYTGSSGVVYFNGSDGKSVDIYLDIEIFPVPKYIWTVIKSDDEAVVFVYLNKPDASNEDVENSKPCEDKCFKLSWATNLLLNDQYKNIEDGYIWCCELRHVREKLSGIPDLVDVTGLLK